MNRIIRFIQAYLTQGHVIRAMAVRDFKTRYRGSSLGLIWAILQPLCMMSVLYLVFRHGLKVGPQGGTSFTAWFFSAMIAWNFFQETLVANAGVFIEYAFLVKKVNFRLAILPLVKVLSSLLVHLVFIGVATAIIWVSGYPPTVHFLLLGYYTFALVILIFSLSWIMSSLNVFFKDITYIIGIVTQIGFWATPIVWNRSLVPDRYHLIVDLNPLVYIIEGYRNALVYHDISLIGFGPTLYFWAFTGTTFVGGWLLFKRLRPYFADVI